MSVPLTCKAIVFVLRPKGERVLHPWKGGTLLETEGDVIVNSKHKKAAELNRGAMLSADNLLFAGQLDKKVIKVLSERVRGEIHQGADPTPDPLQNYQRRTTESLECSASR